MTFPRVILQEVERSWCSVNSESSEQNMLVLVWSVSSQHKLMHIVAVVARSANPLQSNQLFILLIMHVGSFSCSFKSIYRLSPKMAVGSSMRKFACSNLLMYDLKPPVSHGVAGLVLCLIHNGGVCGYF